MSIKDTTNQEANNLMSAGVQKISSAELFNILDDLGFRIDKENTFNYVNRGNAISYNAKSVSIVEKGTGLSFANTEANCYKNRDNGILKELHRIRMDYFVFDAAISGSYNIMRLCKIKPEYCEQGEDPQDLYIVVEDRDDRVLIEPLDCDLSFKPQNCIAKKMIIEC